MNLIFKPQGLLLLLGLLFVSNAGGANRSIALHAETWDMARHGEALLKVAQLAQIVNEWQKSRQQKIQLRYPGGEEGELWVEELKDWLVSLGIPSANIELAPGSDAQDVINMALTKTVENK
ncbi:hypothetical protein MNBD_GAMMA10-846 [hydrothermal vent metagenome]|uniref:Uncharacterized protein n=1 Tax=hydrothermal vent metagenome TaxID=652676 RepID=A0A3B0XYX1_9ZZZZ